MYKGLYQGLAGFRQVTRWKIKHSQLTLMALTALLICCHANSEAADAPSAKLALSFRPINKDITIETPTESEFDQCQVKVERGNKQSGWVVLGPQGQILRRFVDTNGDNVVDQWRYFHHGLEVYRDIDSDFNNKVDQSRWINTGGSRWGLDTNEDGIIDRWKVLSPEEASREAVHSLLLNDIERLNAVLINARDIEMLQISKPLADKIMDSVRQPDLQMKKVLAASKTLNKESRWMRFDGSMPSIIPVDEGKAAQDLIVYENTMAIVETKGETALVFTGELVRIGDVWKLSQVPRPLEGDSSQVSAGGLLMQPEVVQSSTLPVASTNNFSKEIQDLLQSLQKLDNDSPSPAAGRSALVKYNTERAKILSQLIAKAPNQSERDQWTRQMADGLAAAVQTGTYDTGLKSLKELEVQVKQRQPQSSLQAYITYRRLFAEYSIRMLNPESNDAAETQTWWLKQLNDFVAQHPKSEDAADALLQLAIHHEFSGQTAKAREWYQKIVTDHASNPVAPRAKGAIRRLGLVGKSLKLSGKDLNGKPIAIDQYQGKFVLVMFWSTWCKPCTEDLPQLRELYQIYHGKGLEFLGVNLDTAEAEILPYIRKHKITWSHLHEAGGLDSRIAESFGIISLPTMFLVDEKGVVISRNISVEDLKKQLTTLLANK